MRITRKVVLIFVIIVVVVSAAYAILQKLAERGMLARQHFPCAPGRAR